MDLPDLVLSRIFFYLNLDVTEKFRLRLVCKSWKEFIDLQIGAKTSLCVYDERFYECRSPNCYPYKQRWPSNGQVISHSDVLTQTLFENRVGHFWRIQRLAFYRTRKETFGGQEVLPKLLELLSSGLAELSLFATGLLMEDGPVKLERLSFSALKTLRVYEQFTESLQIVAPELEKLILEHWSEPYKVGCRPYTKFERNPPIVLSHPEKLKHLECQMVDRLTAKYFPNLEHLTVRRMNKRPFDLSDYRKLRRLDLWISTYISRPEPVFENFLQQKQNLRMNELTITHFGFKKCFHIEQSSGRWSGPGIPSEFTNVLSLNHRTLKIIENLPGFTDAYLDQRFGISLNLRSLENLSHLDILLDFFCRTNLVELRLRDLSTEQSDWLIPFLRAIQGLEKLRLCECNFSRKFYEQLKSVPFIYKLTVRDCSEIETYDFIEHLNGLLEFEVFYYEVHQNALPFEAFFSAFRKSKLSSLQSENSNLSLRFQRKGKSLVRYPKYQSEWTEFKSAEDLYRFLQNSHQGELEN